MATKVYEEAVEWTSTQIFSKAFGFMLGAGGSPPAAKLQELATRAVLGARVLVDVQIGMGVFAEYKGNDKQTEGSAADSNGGSTRSGSPKRVGHPDESKGNSGVVRKPSGRGGKTS